MIDSGSGEADDDDDDEGVRRTDPGARRLSRDTTRR